MKRIAKQLEALDSNRDHVALTNYIDKLSIGEIQIAARAPLIAAHAIARAWKYTASTARY